MSVLVIGSTGTAGLHVVRALLVRGVSTRVLTRDPEVRQRVTDRPPRTYAHGQIHSQK